MCLELRHVRKSELHFFCYFDVSLSDGFSYMLIVTLDRKDLSDF